MGILDKVKQAAGEAAQAAKKGAAQVQTKVEQSQTRKKADDAARRLGYLVYKERTEGTPAGEEADGLVAEIKDLEEQLAAMESQPGEAEEPKPEAEEGD
jgi:uncharacterized coiled-coil DUF342 family protein